MSEIEFTPAAVARRSRIRDAILARNDKQGGMRPTTDAINDREDPERRWWALIHLAADVLEVERKRMIRRPMAPLAPSPAEGRAA